MFENVILYNLILKKDQTYSCIPVRNSSPVLWLVVTYWTRLSWSLYRYLKMTSLETYFILISEIHHAKWGHALSLIAFGVLISKLHAEKLCVTFRIYTKEVVGFRFAFVFAS